MLDDAAADLEVGQYLEGVDRGGSGVAGGLDEATDLGDERREAGGRTRGRRGRGPPGCSFLLHRVSASCS